MAFEDKLYKRVREVEMTDEIGDHAEAVFCCPSWLCFGDVTQSHKVIMKYIGIPKVSMHRSRVQGKAAAGGAAAAAGRASSSLKQLKGH